MNPVIFFQISPPTQSVYQLLPMIYMELPNCLATPVTLTGDRLSFRFINSPRVRICRHAIKAGTGQNPAKNTIGLTDK